MWFYLGVEFPQDRLCKLFTFDNASPHSPSLSHLHLFLPLLLAVFLSPFTLRLLHHSRPSVPHIIISENTHTHSAHSLQHRWLAWSLSDRWIGKYLLSQIVFLPLSSFHPSTHRLLLHTSMPHSSFFPCCLFQGSSFPMVLPSSYHGAPRRHLLCKHACIHMHIFWIYDWEDGCMYMETHTHVFTYEGHIKQRVDNNCAEDNGVFYEA